MSAEHAPEIGDVEHYVTRSGVHAPADVCVVHPNGTLDLFVKDAPMNFACFRYNVRHNAHGRALSWHWPEWVQEAREQLAQLRDVMPERT